MHKLSVRYVFTLFIIFFSLGVSATTISIIGDTTVGGFGGSEVYSQSFLVGSDTNLVSYELQGRSTSGSNEGIEFEIFRFDNIGTSILGTSLFSMNNTLQASGSLQSIFGATGGLELTEGLFYILTFRHLDGVGGGRFGWDQDSTQYADGEFRFSQASTYNNEATNWNEFGNSDLAIELVFDAGSGAAPVPEPISIVLLSAGLLGLGASRRIKKQA